MIRRLVFFIGFCLGLQQVALSCGCGEPLAFEYAESVASEIFLGRLVNIELYQIGIYINQLTGEDEKMFTSRYTFEVVRKWKGGVASTLVVHNMGTSCDVHFPDLGVNHIIYARRVGESGPTDQTYGTSYFAPKPDELMTWLCTRNFPERSFSGEETDFNAEIDILDKAFPEEVKLRSRFWGVIW